jgi:hypothetical protein
MLCFENIFFAFEMWKYINCINYQEKANIYRENSMNNVVLNFIKWALVRYKWSNFNKWPFALKWQSSISKIYTPFNKTKNLVYYENTKGPDTPDAIRQRDVIF